ncbi:hypothetical protein BU25DRAFT_92489 [Macroventuria anomochaeta]|uniref:Uncharacterized protein n=1 Tax=Macroventuria anomochaeta TaxID=301207 RepID=A0ACB6S0D9_9PLEO|nr:uncharacterized protein BU25DRAFT_92489 [Macroventuria anomochaeta]KAF2626664.1 hypothetical protein BU25DRAFT_92489 [Macroventuria anomochaeta]
MLRRHCVADSASHLSHQVPGSPALARCDSVQYATNTILEHQPTHVNKTHCTLSLDWLLTEACIVQNHNRSARVEVFLGHKTYQHLPNDAKANPSTPEPKTSALQFQPPASHLCLTSAKRKSRKTHLPTSLSLLYIHCLVFCRPMAACSCKKIDTCVIRTHAPEGNA